MPQKMGHVVILTSSGLNHFWENILALFAVMTVYIGKWRLNSAYLILLKIKYLGVILGMAFQAELYPIKQYFFGALSGIFLYMALASLFPVLQETIEDDEINGLANVFWGPLESAVFLESN